MELQFTKKDMSYVAEFTATGDFNLHMESGAPIQAVIYQKSVSEGKYAVAAALNGVGSILDTDVCAAVYPKYIRIESNYAVSNCHVTFT